MFAHCSVLYAGVCRKLPLYALTPFSFCYTVAPNLETVASFSLYFSLLCNPSVISLSSVAFHMESEKHPVLSTPLKLPGPNSFAYTTWVNLKICVHLVLLVFILVNYAGDSKS